MTDQEKIAAYDTIADLIEDRIALEKNHRKNGQNGNTFICEVRADAFNAVVRLYAGRDALPDIHNWPQLGPAVSKKENDPKV
jgi:hypothetical protein